MSNLESLLQKDVRPCTSRALNAVSKKYQGSRDFVTDPFRESAIAARCRSHRCRHDVGGDSSHENHAHSFVLQGRYSEIIIHNYSPNSLSPFSMIA